MFIIITEGGVLIQLCNLLEFLYLSRLLSDYSRRLRTLVFEVGYSLRGGSGFKELTARRSRLHCIGLGNSLERLDNGSGEHIQKATKVRRMAVDAHNTCSSKVM